jgi:hypothetical protein
MSQQKSANKSQIDCPLAHTLVNKLSVVVGNCDLLLEKTPQDSPLASRMKLIRDTAQSMAADLLEFQFDLEKKCLEKVRQVSITQ